MFGLFGRSSKKKCLAIDIGNGNVKMVLFDPSRALIEKMITRATPEDSFEEGMIKSEGPLPDFLMQCVADMDLNEDDFQVVTGIYGKNVIAKKLDIPQMEEVLIPEFVEIEAEQELFYNKNEMELDYEILRGVNFDKPEAQSLIVITVGKKVIERYNDVMGLASLGCDILDTNFSALFNSVEYNEDLNEHTNYMLIDVGRSSTNLLILIKNQVVFARNLQVGGDFCNQKIQQKMGVDYQEAEELKISASRGEAAPEELTQLIQNEANPLFSEEVQSCYELYCSLFPEKNVNQVYITGGGSQTLGLASALAEKLAVPVEIFDPFQKINVSPELEVEKESLRCFAGTVSGLALRSIQ